MNISTTTEEGKVIPTSDHSDFKTLNSEMKKATGSQCMSDSARSITSIVERAKKCMCTSGSKSARDKIRKILKKHSDWKNTKITMKQSQNSSTTIDTSNVEDEPEFCK